MLRYMYRLIFLLLLATFLFGSPVLAQYQHLLHKPYAEKMTGIHAMYKDLIDTQDSVQRERKAEVIKRFARKAVVTLCGLLIKSLKQL